MAKKISTLPVGAKIKDPQSVYYGKPLIWQIADKNHAGYPANAITLITEKIIALKAFDGMESSNPDSNRRSYGNNNYKLSNILQWLNSQAAAGKWYSGQHSHDAPPTNANSWSSHNGYDTEAGFLNGFSSDFVAALLDTTVKVVKNTVTDGGGSENVVSKIFLPSTTEVGLANEAGIAEGSKLALFDGDVSRQAKPTAEAVNKSSYTHSSLNVNSPWYWWLRTPYASNSCNARIVNLSGALNNNNACYGNRGVRPLCNLSSEILVSDTPDTDGAYEIVWNRPPTTPGSITVPSVVQAGKTLEISWGISTDPDGNSIGYTLERKIDEGSFTQIYKGINRTFTDSITKGWVNVTYRVKAYDSNGAESQYATSAKRVVNNNQPPEITSESPGDLGLKTGAFGVQYKITDPDAGQTLTVTEYVNGVTKRSFAATSGSTYTFNMTNAEWQQLPNGSHEIKIVGQDSEDGVGEKTFTFSKNETEILMELKDPLPADAMITKTIISIVKTVPEGAIVKIEACNNAFDTNPTWEDVTTTVERNGKIFFSNEIKTAANWGYNIRVSIKRNGTNGECFVSSIGGNYE